MIRVNLLPIEAGKRPGAAKSFKLPTGGVWPYFGALALLYIVTLYGGYRIWQTGKNWKNRIATVQQNKGKLEKRVQAREVEFAAQNATMQEVEEKYQVAKALSPENRVFWSEKLNMLAKSRIDLAVFITKLQLTEQITEVETPESVKAREEFRNRKTKKPGEREPKAIKKPIINQDLTIQAIAYGNDSPQRLRQFNSFQEVLRSMQWERENGTSVRFIDGMRPDFQVLPQKMAPVGGVDVLRFGLVCRAEPQFQSGTPAVKKTGAGGATAKPATGGQSK